MDYRAEYKKWAESKYITDDEKAELAAISGNGNEIEGRFFSPLSFGTAGLRGIMGMGTYRMNIYTVRQATQGLAEVICSYGKDAVRRGAAVCFDCRNNSREFAHAAASVLSANGINVKIFEDMRPTPELSFAIRHYGCIAGINITASHNPKEYNGYKVYWEDGAQLPPEEAAKIAEKMAGCDIFTGAKTESFDDAVAAGRIKIIGSETDEAFLDAVMKCRVDEKAAKLAGDKIKIVYTPFHGTGFKLIPEVLRRSGFENVFCVESQMITDGNFPTVKSPNPEEEAGFELSRKLAAEKNADIIIGSDPDADRIGVLVKNKSGGYTQISGNKVGVLLLNYIIDGLKASGRLPQNAAAIKTIVTTEMAKEICTAKGVKCFSTFTGFKFMAEKIKQLEAAGEGKYIFAYEESYGYLAGGHARDKDAVTAAMLVSEMAAHYYNKGQTLLDVLDGLYEQFGYYKEKTINVVMPGTAGIRDMKKLMASLRSETFRDIAGISVAEKRDYLTGDVFDSAGNKIGKTDISGSDVIYYLLDDGSSFIIRPSGTEPKIKIYALVKGSSDADADSKIGLLCKAAESLNKVPV